MRMRHSDAKNSNSNNNIDKNNNNNNDDDSSSRMIILSFLLSPSLFQSHPAPHLHAAFLMNGCPFLFPGLHDTDTGMIEDLL